jgi:hypothetical protein
VAAVVSNGLFCLLYLKSSVNQAMELHVYNSTTKETRVVQLTPTTNWPGEGLLGIKIKWSLYDSSADELGELVDFKARSKSTDTADSGSRRPSTDERPSFGFSDAAILPVEAVLEVCPETVLGVVPEVALGKGDEVQATALCVVSGAGE